MWTYTSIREQAARSGQTAGRVFTVVRTQPSWVSRVALTAGAVVLLAVVLLLVVPALLIAFLVFLLLAAVLHTWHSVRSLFRFERTGRRNVRVISRR
ncbi:MAG: hypothetical protein IPJ41_01560 [Phycisphaerales bacterium]|nr:hypothetical protein [Phycisphaerales bacterium]